MLRSSAKNHKYVAVLTSPDQYESFIDNWKMKDLKPPKRKNLPHTTLAARKQYAASAFQLSAQYDTNIAEYFAQQLEVQSATRESETKTEELTSEDHVFDPALKTTRTYNCEFKLKYGANPHQLPAAVYSIEESSQLNQTTLPFTILNGTPGYINLMDALYGWQLVTEASNVLNTPVAASYKHCSPAGAALGSEPLTSAEAAAYEISDPTELSPVVSMTSLFIILLSVLYVCIYIIIIKYIMILLCIPVCSPYSYNNRMSTIYRPYPIYELAMLIPYAPLVTWLLSPILLIYVRLNY